jgi:16S rRNA (guanine966-N2)-methyltransferase
LRVIAGQYRSRPLRSSRGMDIRPTADRLRETLFDVLTAGNPGALEGSVWMDLYAGTGAVGIEALSRGAERAYFVESAAAAARLIRENLDSLQITERYEILQSDVLKALRALAGKSIAADFVFLDPPYRLHQAYDDTLEFLQQSPAVKPTGVIVAEHEKRMHLEETYGDVKRYRKLVQGDAALSFYRRG